VRTSLHGRRNERVPVSSEVASTIATTSPTKSMTESACSQATVRGSNPNRAGWSASPECGPDPVTTVPSTITTTPMAPVSPATVRSMGGVLGCSPVRGARESMSRRSTRVLSTTRAMEMRKWAITVPG